MDTTNLHKHAQIDYYRLVERAATIIGDTHRFSHEDRDNPAVRPVYRSLRIVVEYIIEVKNLGKGCGVEENGNRFDGSHFTFRGSQSEEPDADADADADCDAALQRGTGCTTVPHSWSTVASNEIQSWPILS